jgi:hypothetical protein
MGRGSHETLKYLLGVNSVGVGILNGKMADNWNEICRLSNNGVTSTEGV